MSYSKKWREAFKEKLKEKSNYGWFAPNAYHTDKQWIRFFSKIEKLGGIVSLDVLDWESIKIDMPLDIYIREKILIYILTILPSTSEPAIFSKKNMEIQLVWS